MAAAKTNGRHYHRAQDSLGSFDRPLSPAEEAELTSRGGYQVLPLSTLKDYSPAPEQKPASAPAIREKPKPARRVVADSKRIDFFGGE